MFMSSGNDLLFVATRQGVLTAQREGHVWRPATRNLGSHRVTTMSIHGGMALAGTTNGIYRSDDAGQTWRSVNQGLTQPHVRWLAFHPRQGHLALAGTEPAALFLSRDGGETWSERPEVAELREKGGWYLPYSPEAGCVRGLAFHGDRAYAAVEQGGLLRSDDHGERWHLVAGSSGDTEPPQPGFIHPDVHSVAVHPSSPDWVMAPTGGGLYRSKDGGATWDHLYRCYCRAVWVDPADRNRLLFGPADGVDRQGRIEASADGGHTWTPASEGLDTPWSHHMVERFLPAGQELLAVLSNGHLLATSLAKLGWRRILPEVDDALALAAMRL
jgi:photosystem II stability/assembly factor-like uncharacterized protein